jgi:glycosyltransferase involved in cell wall biosynthesis
MYQWADKINWDAVDRVIVVSQAKLHEFTELFPQHAHKALVIPEAVSVTRFTPADKPYRGDIGILCHLKPRKRVYELVLAFAELLDQRSDFHLHIGGGRAAAFGDYHDAVVQLVERLGLRDKVTFYGHVSTPETWYPLIDVFISNGYSEGLQVSPMEAMAAGRYCLSHRWDGADELLPAGNLYDTNTQLRNLLVQYADLTPADRQRTQACMRSRVCDKFNVDVTKVQIRGVIEEVAASRRAAAGGA